jgi:probable rRNA maturation factor
MKKKGGRRKVEGGKGKRKTARSSDSAGATKVRMKVPKSKTKTTSAFRLPPSAFKIEATNQQQRWPVKLKQLQDAVRAVLTGEKIKQADISLAVVDDPTIHQINQQFLQHDEPTDCISFLLEQDGDRIDGDILVSADTAAHSAHDFGWHVQDELLLYAIHGMLHLVGYDDLKPAKKRLMRQRERHYLAKFGLKPRYKLNSVSGAVDEKLPATRSRKKTARAKTARPKAVSGSR